MRLSAPIFRLKRQAKLLSRDQNIPLHQALDHVAVGEGFKAWSHLASAAPTPSISETILAGLSGGDMLLLAARPGHGKTLAGLEIAATAHRRQMNGLFFTLDYTKADVTARWQDIGGAQHVAADTVEVDTSDEICADHIIAALGDAPRGSVVEAIERINHAAQWMIVQWVGVVWRKAAREDVSHLIGGAQPGQIRDDAQGRCHCGKPVPQGFGH